MMSTHLYSGYLHDRMFTLNVCKCITLLISRKHSPQSAQYVLIGEQPLEKVQVYKYLGILISSDLTWSDHIANVCSVPNVIWTSLLLVLPGCWSIQLLYIRVLYLIHLYILDHTWSTQLLSGVLTLWKMLKLWSLCRDLQQKYAQRNGTILATKTQSKAAEHWFSRVQEALLEATLSIHGSQWTILLSKYTPIVFTPV